VRLVEVFGPLALWNALASKLVEGLPGEGLTGVPHADPVDLAAADVHGGNAAIAFDFEGRLVAFPAGPEGGDEPGHGGVAGPRKGSEDGGVGMIGDELVTAPFQLFDLVAQRGEQREKTCAKCHRGSAASAADRAIVGPGRLPAEYPR